MTLMRPRELVRTWAEAFNRADIDRLQLTFLRVQGLPLPTDR